MQDTRVLIIGGGIGGLTTALALQRSGFRVSIFEQAPELTDVGAGLTVASNGTIVLKHLGLDQILDDIALTPDRGAVLHYRTGEVLVNIPRGNVQVEKFGAPYCQMHRADLHTAMLKMVLANDSDCIHLNYSFTDLTQADDQVSAHFSNGETVTGNVLVGCDGIRSAVRARLFGEEEPHFTGYVAWRGLVPINALPSEIIVPDSAVWIGPGHFFTRYKVSRGEYLNYVAVARTNDWFEEGWSVRSTVDTVLKEFETFEPTARTILAATPPDHCYKWGIFDREPLPEWTIGNVTLLGDAAHPMTPFLGQGAVMALEDAMVFARAFEQSSAVAEALKRYEDARKERTTFVFEQSRKNGDQLTTYDPDGFNPETYVNEESLGLAAYNAVNVSI